MSKRQATPDIQQVAKNWNDRGFSCSLCNDPPGAVWKDYVHDTDELIMPVAGGVEVETPKETAQLAPGQEFLVPAQVTHTVRTPDDGPSQWLSGIAGDDAHTD